MIQIGWNPITHSWDKLYAADFKEELRRDTSLVKSYKGKEVPLDQRRATKIGVWEDEDLKVFWPWEPNA